MVMYMLTLPHAAMRMRIFVSGARNTAVYKKAHERVHCKIEFAGEEMVAVVRTILLTALVLIPSQ